MSEPDVLPCGTAVDDLLDHVADGAPASRHAATCPHCRSRLRSLQHSWSAVAAARATATPPPAGLGERVIGRLRATWNAGDTDLVLPGSRGRTRVRPTAVVALALAAANRVPGVRGDTGRFEDGRLQLSIRAHADRPLTELAALVRTQVRTDLGRTLQEPPPPVDIDVTEVWY